MTVFAVPNSAPLVSPPPALAPKPPPSSKGITTTTLPAPEVINGPANAVYGNSPPVGAPFSLVISTTFPITLPGLQLTFTAPDGSSFIANPSDFFVHQDTGVFGNQFPPNQWLEYNPSTPSLFNQAGQWTVTLSNGNSGFPITTYKMGIGGFLPPSAINIIGQGAQPYTAQGVMFPGSTSTFLSCPSLNCINVLTGAGSDNGQFCFSFWAQSLTSSLGEVFVMDPSNNYDPFFQTSGAGNNPQLQMNLFGGLGIQFNCLWTPPFPPSDTNWHHYLGSFVTQRSAGNKIGVLYIDDVLQASTLQDTSGSFINPINGKSFFFGNDGGVTSHATKMGISDVWISPNDNLLALDPKGVLLPYVPYEDRRVFTSVIGHALLPNNPSVFPAAPIIFTGNSNVFGGNLGFGGTFTLNGALSDITGPGGVPV